MTGAASVAATRAFLANGDVDAAETGLAALLAAGPSPEVLHLAAMVDAARGRPAAAAERLRLALALEPQRARWQCDLGASLLADQQPAAAEEVFAAAIALDSQLASAWRGLAQARASLGDAPGAFAALRHALSLDPHSAVAHRLAAAAHRANRDYPLSRRHEAEVLRARPGDHAARARLAFDCWLTDDLPAALHHARAVVHANASTQELYCIYLYLLLFDPAQSGASLRAAHEEWARRFAPPPLPLSTCPAPDPHRRLRLGYLSAEFFGGPPVFFLSPLLAAHDRENFEIFLYHVSSQSDEHTGWFRSQACHWRDCHSLSDTELLATIRQDQIDILIDPSGFSVHHRMTVFAQRAAPLQLNYPSYPCTRGIAAFDFLLTDRWATPPGTEAEYTETPVRLPSGYLAYLPPPDAPPVTPLPALGNGFVTFGMFQRRVKLNPPVFDALAEILHRVPGSRLLLQHADPGLEDPHSPARHALIREFLLRGIPESRVDYRGSRPRAAMMALMAEADIILDTFPFAGQTTTCESLWMGVPVVTLAGDTHPSRVGASLLASVGLPSWIAHSPGEYVRLATDFASDWPALAALRGQMRQRLVDFGLVDGVRLARETEAALRHLWHGWCAQQNQHEGAH